MRHVIRRVLGLVGVTLLLLAVATASGIAQAPEGPRLAISISTDGPGAEDESWAVITTGQSGENPGTLLRVREVLIGNALSWSADGIRLAFQAGGVESTASGPFGTGWPVVGVTGVDGAPHRVFPGAFLNAGEPVMAPDGRSVVFHRMKRIEAPPGSDGPSYKSSIWLLDVEDGSVGRLTRWRLKDFLFPISYSADGAALVAEIFDGPGPRLVAIDLRSLRTHHLASLARDDYQPTYSPAGSRLAFVRVRYGRSPELLPSRPVSELLVARADGSGARRLLRRNGYISSLGWDPSGSRLTFTRNPPAEATGGLEPEPGNKVMAINADGTCLTRVFTDPEMTVHGSAWQPGVGREAGRIGC